MLYLVIEIALQHLNQEKIIFISDNFFKKIMLQYKIKSSVHSELVEIPLFCFLIIKLIQKIYFLNYNILIILKLLSNH